MTQKKLVRLKGNVNRYFYSKYKDYDMEFAVYEVEDVMTGDCWSSAFYSDIVDWCKCKTKEEREAYERMYA